MPASDLDAAANEILAGDRAALRNIDRVYGASARLRAEPLAVAELSAAKGHMRQDELLERAAVIEPGVSYLRIESIAALGAFANACTGEVELRTESDSSPRFIEAVSDGRRLQVGAAKPPPLNGPWSRDCDISTAGGVRAHPAVFYALDGACAVSNRSLDFFPGNISIVPTSTGIFVSTARSTREAGGGLVGLFTCRVPWQDFSLEEVDGPFVLSADSVRSLLRRWGSAGAITFGRKGEHAYWGGRGWRATMREEAIKPANYWERVTSTDRATSIGWATFSLSDLVGALQLSPYRRGPTPCAAFDETTLRFAVVAAPRFESPVFGDFADLSVYTTVDPIYKGKTEYGFAAPISVLESALRALRMSDLVRVAWTDEVIAIRGTKGDVTSSVLVPNYYRHCRQVLDGLQGS